MLFLFSLFAIISASAQVTEAEFHSSLEKIEKFAGPSFTFSARWESELEQGWTNVGRLISIPGGLGRVQGMTADGLLLWYCHELGHHQGGAPRHAHPNLKWSSVEGQADYYATSQCLPKLFADDDNVGLMENKSIPWTARLMCERTYKDFAAKAICFRSALAAQAAIRAELHGKNMPQFNTPDRTRVTETEEDHPDVQCRLDTFLQGALHGPRPACWFNYDLAKSYSARD